MLSHWFFLYALCLLRPLNAVPTEKPKPEACSEACSGVTDLADLGVFKSHVYSIRINHRITSPLSATGYVNYLINGTAEILGGTDCNYELRLKDVSVREMDVSGTERLQDEHGRLLEANNLQFAYDNGLITAICPSENETAFTQNVKVSILSHLQVTMNSFQLPSVVIEDDISGRCLTRYFPKPSAERADAWTIRKVKSTAGCANKYSRKTRFDGIDLRLAQDTSNSMILDGAQTCTITLPAGGTVSHAECSENMTISGLFRGNLTQINTVSVDTVLHLISSDTGASPATDKEEPIKRIEFGHTAVFVDVNAQTANLVEASQTLTAVLVGDFTNRATSFANLIRLIRKMDSEQLEELYNIYKDTKQAKDLLKQAIYSAGTEVALTHLMNELNAGQFNAPIFQLSLLPSPNLTQIEIIGNLLRSTDVKSLGLIVSTLVDRYCQSHPRCMQDEIILKNLRQLESSLRYDCSTDSEEARDGVIITLRAIGNVGRVSNKSEVYPVLERCLLQPNIFLRSATAEVFRKFPCDEEADELLLSILKKRDEEAEVRIQAYLSWSRCLSEGKLLSLLSILLIDPSDQVKSFVASHLVSIRNSQDPFKADKRRMLESLQPNFSFIFNYADADLRRHSMYFDKHYYPDQFGGGVEATVIYGPTSPLPRYVSVNVTFRGFGRSFNLLEVGYRSEFGGKLRRTLLNEPEEMPSTYDGRELPYPAKHYEFFRESERRNFAFMRIFGHEVFQSTNADRDFMNLYPAQEVQSSLLEVDEVTSLPTIGGLSLQISMLGVSSQKLKYGLNWTNVLIDFDARISASLQTSVALLTPSGPIGFQTDDKLFAGLPFYFKLDWPPSRYSVELLLGGIKPNQHLLKYERGTQEIGHQRLTPLRLEGFDNTIISRTPALLEKVIGLSAVVSQKCNPKLDLCNSFSLEVEKYDGLAVFFRRHLSRDIELRCGNPRLHRSAEDTDNLLLFSYQPQLGNLTFRSRFPWDIEYGFRGYYTESDFDGLLTFGGWNTRLNGSLVTTSTDEWELKSQLSSFDRGLKFSYKKKESNKYYLLTENTGSLLPFYLLSSNDYGCSNDSTNCENAWNHTTVLSTKNAGVELRMHREEGICRKNDATFSLYWDAHDQKKATNFSLSSISCPQREGTASSVPLYNSSLSLLHKRGEETEWELAAGSLINLNFLRPSLAANFSHWLNISKLSHFLDSQQNGPDDISAKVNGYLVLSNLTVEGYQVGLEELRLNATYIGDSMHTYGLRSRLVASEKRYTATLTSALSPEIQVDTNYTIEAEQNFFFAFNSSIQKFNKSEVYAVKGSLFVNDTEHTVGLQYSLEEASDNDSLLLTSAKIQTPYRLQFPLNCSFSFMFPLSLKQSQLAGNSELFFSPTTVSFGLSTWNQPFLALTQGRGFTAGFRYNFENVRVFDADGYLKVYQNPSLNSSHSFSLTARQNDDKLRLYAIRAETSAGNEANMRFQQEKDKLALLFALKPAVQTETFKGLFYKSTSRYSQTSSEFILTHTGEWNVNQGFAPGMPFRYGLEYTHAPNFTTGQVYVYADDSLLGKLTHVELLEMMYDYSSDLRRTEYPMVYQLNSEGMLNWRQYMGRGTVSSHVTLNGNLSSNFRAGNVELIAELPDKNQSHLRILLDCSVGGSMNTLTSEAFLDGRPMYSLNTSLMQDRRGRFNFIGCLKTVPASSPILELQLMHESICKYYSCSHYRPSFDMFWSPRRLIGSLNSSLTLLPSFTVTYDTEGNDRNLTGYLTHRNTTYVDTVIRTVNEIADLEAYFLSSNPILPVKVNITSTFLSSVSTRRLDGTIELPKQEITLKLSNCSLQRKYDKTRFVGEVFLHTGFTDWTRVHLTQSVVVKRTKNRIGLSLTTLGLREGSRFFSLDLHDASLLNTRLALFTHLPKPIFGLAMTDLLLEKQTTDKAAQVNVSGHFYSRPVLLNSEFKLSLVDSLFIWPLPRLISLVRQPRKQLVDAVLSCSTSDAKNHTADISWRFAKKAEQSDGGYSLSTSARLKSDYLPHKEIKFSLIQPFGWYPSLRGCLRSGAMYNFTYSLNCSSFFLPPKCSLLVENLGPSLRSFEKAELTLKRSDSDGPIHLRFTVDEKHKAVVELLYASQPKKPTLLYVNSSLQINGVSVFDATTKLKQSNCESNYSILLESSERWRTVAGQQSGLSVRLLIGKTYDSAEASAGVVLTTPDNASDATSIGGNIGFSTSDNLSHVEWHINSLSRGRVAYLPRTYETTVSLSLNNTLVGFPINIKGRTNLLRLLQAIETRQSQPAHKAYFIEFQNSCISVGLQTGPKVNFTLLCRLRDFNQSLTFQTAFALANTREHKRLKLDLDVEKPRNARLLFDWFLLSNDTENLGVTIVTTGIAFGTLIPKTVATFFVQPLGDSRPRHLNFTLESKLAVLNAFLRSRPDGSKHEVRISFESPQNNTLLVPFVLTGQCDPRLTLETPCEIIYRTAAREALVGARRTPLGITSEIAWNRLRNGTVKVHFNHSVWSFETPRRVLTLGRNFAGSEDNATGYFLRLLPQNQEVVDYIEVCTDEPDQLAIRSTWLKSPIGAKWELGVSKFSFNLYTGPADRKIRDLITMTFAAGEDDKGYLFFKNSENTFSAQTSLKRSRSQGIQLLVNFTLNAKNGTATLEYLPQKRLLASLSDQDHVEFSLEQQPGQLTFNFTNILLGGEIQANGNLMFLKEPLSLFVNVRSITSEGLLRLDMKDYLNVDAEILHSSMQAPAVLDARLVTRLANNYLYNFQFFWRPEAISELLADGLRNFTQDGFDSTIVKMLDPFLLLTESELTQMWKLLNHSAIYASFTAITEDAAVILDTLEAFKNDGICLVGLLENVTLSSVKYLKQALSANSMSSTYQALYDSVINMVDKVEGMTWNLLNTTRNAATFVRTMNATGRFGERMFACLQNGVQGLIEVSSASFETLSQSMHSFGTSLATILNKVGTILARQVASDLDAISNTFLKERAELLEAMQSVAARTKDGLSYLLSLVASQNALAALQELAIGNISGAVKKYFKPEESQYEANWGALSVNASIHVPQDLLQAASLPIAFYGGKTLQPGSWPQCILQVSRSLLREFFDPDVFASLRTAPANISQSLKYNAWLFIMPQSRPQIIRFDGRIREPDMRQHALYVLASDTLGHTFSLMLLTSEDNYEFKLVYGGQTFTFNRETNLQVTKQLYWKRDPIESPMNIRNQNTWLLTGTSAQITFVYDMFRHVLWMQFGTKWHGRLNGLFGSTTAVNFNRNYHVPMDHSWTAQEKPSWKTWEYRDRFDVHFHSWIRNNQVDEQIVAEWFAHYTSCNRRIDITPFLKISSQKKDSRNRQRACSALAGYLYACEGTKEDAFFDHNCAGERYPRTTAPPMYIDPWHYGTRRPWYPYNG